MVHIQFKREQGVTHGWNLVAPLVVIALIMSIQFNCFPFVLTQSLLRICQHRAGDKDVQVGWQAALRIGQALCHVSCTLEQHFGIFRIR